MRTTVALALLIAASFSAPTIAKENSYQVCSPPFSGPPFCQPPMQRLETSSSSDRRGAVQAPTQAPKQTSQGATASKK